MTRLSFAVLLFIPLTPVMAGENDTPSPPQPETFSAKAPPLSAEQSIATMEIQNGYRITPVLTEPQIHEPAAIAWDGNGRMYVIEMRTYMQDIDGKHQLRPVSRVSRRRHRQRWHLRSAYRFRR